MLDAKLKRVRIKYGMEGYGLYWYCLELIAQTVEPHNLSFELEHDAEIIAHDTGIHYARVQEMMVYMTEQGLFESLDGIITCLKMAARTDEYTQKLLRGNESIRTKSRHAPDKIPPNRREENRLDKKREEEKREEQKPFVPAKKPQEIVEIEYPAELNKQAWREWIDHRKQAKMKKLTPKGEALAMKNLVAMGDYETQRSIIEQSMSQGWTGLFLLKGEKPSQKNKRDDIMAFVYGDDNGRRKEKIIEGETYETE